MDEAIERLMDIISGHEGVPRKQAELILLNLLGEIERLLERVRDFGAGVMLTAR